MATVTPYYGATLPSGTDRADVNVLNDNTTLWDLELHNESVRAAANIANIYDATATYAVGDYCTYQNVAYKCTTATAAPAGAFDADYWSQVNALDEIAGSSGSATLSGLTDVDISSPADEQVLTYDATTQKWVNAASGTGGSTTLAGLNDVDVTSVTDGQALVYDGTEQKWVGGGAIPTALSDLSEDSTHRVVTDTEKTTWNAKSDFSGSYADLTNKPTIPSAIDDLSDVAITSVADGEFLRYDSTESKWVNEAVVPVQVITVASFSSLPQTISNANITANHRVIRTELGTPSAQTSDWTWTTANGSVTIAGSISGSTTMTLYLAKGEDL